MTKRYSLLIVDDRASNILALANILKAEYDIFVSKNGRDAIRVANEKLPDVILLDIVMPDMSGYEVISVLKREERTRNIPVIFISGLNSVDSEEKGLALQAADYITKPFSAVIVQLRVRNQIKIISQMRAIEEMSMTDQLTGIPNRRSFDARLELEWNRAVREKTALSLLMADVDNFKPYNDTHGHQQGDAALRAIAGSFSKSIKRATDFFARWGGEEFSILLSDSGHVEALNMAELVRKEVSETKILDESGNEANVTVSIGVHTVFPALENKIEKFVAGADAALYAAKQAGRDCVREYI